MINYHMPAFPNAKVVINGLDEQGGVSGYAPGLTMLDHFAGLAMPVIATEIYSWGKKLEGGTVPELTAKMSYEMANAMLKERAKWIK